MTVEAFKRLSVKPCPLWYLDRNKRECEPAKNADDAIEELFLIINYTIA